jgi:hypothetical protein
MTLTKIRVRTALAAVALFLALAPSAYAQQVRLEAQLFGSDADPLASGKARFEARADRIRLTVEVEDVSASASGVLAIFANDTLVGMVSIDAFGFADLNLDSRLGDDVPVLQRGDMITVYDAEDGTPIVGGTLR